jgi:uncharacterized membrane protein (DUF485 family)
MNVRDFNLFKGVDWASFTWENLPDLLSGLLDLLLGFASLVAILFLLIGAYNYLTAFGDEQKATKGKSTLTYAIAGIGVIVSAWIIVHTVFRFFTGDYAPDPTDTTNTRVLPDIETGTDDVVPPPVTVPELELEEDPSDQKVGDR